MPKTYIPTTIGKILKELRADKNISSRRLGQKLEISREMLVAMESNRSNPSLHNLILILNSLDCEILVVKKDTYKTFGKLEILDTTSETEPNQE